MASARDLERPHRDDRLRLDRTRHAAPASCAISRCDRSKFTIIDPSEPNRHLADKEGLTFVKEAVTRQNYKSLLTPLLTAGPGPAFIVNLSVDVSSIDIQKLAQRTGSLYIDTVIEPWPGFYYNSKLDNAARTNYAMREQMLALKSEISGGHTSVSCCGANPGMVSWFVKQALLDIAADRRRSKVKEPTTREEWGKLMKRFGVKGIHIAERDTQRAKNAQAARHLRQHLVGRRLHLGRPAAGRARLGHA